MERIAAFLTQVAALPAGGVVICTPFLHGRESTGPPAETIR